MPASGRPNPAVDNTTITVCASEQQCVLIDRAVAALGMTRADFMRDTALREVEAVLGDQGHLVLDPSAFRAFTDRIDAPPADNPPLRRLLAERAPWER